MTISKTLFCFFLIIALLNVSAGIAQKKECKFLKGKDETGKVIQMIAAPAKIGTFYVGKKGDNYFISYATKTIFLLAQNTENQTQLGIDSVRFYFDNKNITTLPAIGIGKIQNEIKLNYTFDYVRFEVPLSQDMVAKFLATKLTDVQILGEKEAKLHDALTDKNQEKLIQAFTCWQ